MYFENVVKNVWDGFTPKSGIVKKNNSESCFFQHEDLHYSTGHEEITFHWEQSSVHFSGIKSILFAKE